MNPESLSGLGSSARKRATQSVSIGYHRDDGDFAILATLNNNDDHSTASGEFESMCSAVQLMWQGVESLRDEDIMLLERQDTPDYVDIDDEVSL